MRQYVDVYGALFQGRLGGHLDHEATAVSVGNRHRIVLAADTSEELERLVVKTGGRLLPEAAACQCYGAAKVIEYGRSDERWWMVKCCKCGVEDGDTRGGPEHAIELWNRRIASLRSFQKPVSPNGEKEASDENS